MKKLRISLVMILNASLILSGCSSWNKTQKEAVTGTSAGGSMGSVIGRTAGNKGPGSITGAGVGGASGVVIGIKMDKQAEEIKKSVPDAMVERIGDGIVVEFSNNILFGFDKSLLAFNAKTNLDRLYKVLNEYTDTDIELQGHTDNKGSKAYNKNLSEKRANTVSGYLIAKGITASRITIIGFGENAPKYKNNTEVGRNQNRRVEFLITANEKMKADAE